MDELVKTLTSQTFWVSSVFFTLLANLVQPFINRRLERLSQSYADKRRKQREETDRSQHETAVAVRSDPQVLALDISDEQRQRAGSLLWTGYCVLALGTAILAGQPEFPPETPWYRSTRPFEVFSLILFAFAVLNVVRHNREASIFESILRQARTSTKMEAAKAQVGDIDS